MLHADWEQTKKKTLTLVQNQLDWVEITFASQRTFAFCSTDRVNICSSCTLCRHWHFVYNTVLCWPVMTESRWWKIYRLSYSKLSCYTDTQEKRKPQEKWREEECQKAPDNFNHYNKICSARFRTKRGAPAPAPCAFLSQLLPCLKMPLEWNMFICRIENIYSVSWKTICFPSSMNLRQNYYSKKNNQNLSLLL